MAGTGYTRVVASVGKVKKSIMIKKGEGMQSAVSRAKANGTGIPLSKLKTEEAKTRTKPVWKKSAPAKKGKGATKGKAIAKGKAAPKATKKAVKAAPKPKAAVAAKQPAQAMKKAKKK